MIHIQWGNPWSKPSAQCLQEMQTIQAVTLSVWFEEKVHDSRMFAAD